MVRIVDIGLKHVGFLFNFLQNALKSTNLNCAGFIFTIYRFLKSIILFGLGFRKVTALSNNAVVNPKCLCKNENT